MLRKICSMIALCCALGTSAYAAENPAIDPAAIAALEKMGAYLRTLSSFQVEASTSDEDVMDDGQKIQHDGVTSIVAKLPSHLRADVSSDTHERMYFFDGNEFTLFAKRINYYATIPAPGRIAQLADRLEEKYDLSIPLQDLFRWGAVGWSGSGDIKAAMKVGPSVVEGATCEQYAFRQDDIDWQIWIQRGDHPLPRKIIITDRTDEARPQHTAVYTWNLAPSFNEAAFKFQPPEGAKRVRLAEASVSK